MKIRTAALIGACTVVLLAASQVPAVAAPPHHSAAQAVALVKKADPQTKRIGRAAISSGMITAGGIRFTLPSSGSATTTADASVVTAATTNFVAFAISDGVQVAAVFDRPDEATQTYRFPGHYLELGPSGTVIVRSGGPTGEPVALVDKPWAVDASGLELNTHFAVSGDSVTQITQTNSTTSYPVVADPLWRFRGAWYGVSMDFSKSGTKNLALSTSGCGSIGSIATAIAAAAGVTTAVVVGVLMGACSTISWMADSAYSQGRCVSLKIITIPPFAIVPWITTCYA